jgi:hypothetical protein
MDIAFSYFNSKPPALCAGREAGAGVDKAAVLASGAGPSRRPPSIKAPREGTPTLSVGST